MPRSTPLQTTFNGGELSPRMMGRVDIDKYITSVETMENFIATIQGPAVRRSGTRFIGDVIDSTAKSRLIPFVYSDDQSYVLEFSPNKIRIFTIEARLLPKAHAFAYTAVTAAADTITVPDFSYAEGQGPFRFTTDDALFTVGGSAILVGTDYYIRRVAGSDDTFKVATTPTGTPINIDGQGTGNHTITPQASVVGIEIDTTYTEDEIFKIQFAQSADSLYIVQANHPPAKLERIGLQQWRFADVAFWDGPYDAEDTTRDTQLSINASLAGFATNLEAWESNGTTPKAIFKASDIGRHFRLRHELVETGYQWAWGRITAVAADGESASGYLERDAICAYCDAPDNLDGHAKTPYWRLGSWYPGNYPTCVAFHEQRLLFAGEPANPQRFHGSVIGDFESFMPDGEPNRGTDDGDADGLIAADNAYSFTISSGEVNGISWLSATRNLLAGTLGGIWPVQASSNLEPISVENINVRRSSARGASAIVPVVVEDGTVYLSRTARRLMQVAYSFQSDAFVPVDLSVLADHITSPEITAIAYSMEPDSILWALRSDGILGGLSIDGQQDVMAWHRNIIGGSFGIRTFTSGDVTIGTDEITIASHEYANGFGPVRLSTLGTLPTGLYAGKDYWIIDKGVNAIEFTETSGGAKSTATAPVDITHAGSGTHTITPTNSHAVVESITVIPAPSGFVTPDAHKNERHDQLWLVVKRTVNGATKRHIEFMEDRFPADAQTHDGFFVDSGLTLGPTQGLGSVTTVSGLEHLEGESVKVLVDGAVHPMQTVSSGSISLQNAGKLIHVGLPMFSTLKTLRLITGDPQGPSQGKRKRIDNILLRMDRTLGIEVATNSEGTDFDNVFFRTGSDPMDAAPPLFTGDKILPIDIGWESEGQITLRAMDPLPATVLAVGYRASSSQRGSE